MKEEYDAFSKFAVLSKFNPLLVDSKGIKNFLETLAKTLVYNFLTEDKGRTEISFDIGAITVYEHQTDAWNKNMVLFCNPVHTAKQHEKICRLICEYLYYIENLKSSGVGIGDFLFRDLPRYLSKPFLCRFELQEEDRESVIVNGQYLNETCDSFIWNWRFPLEHSLCLSAPPSGSLFSDFKDQMQERGFIIVGPETEEALVNKNCSIDRPTSIDVKKLGLKFSENEFLIPEEITKAITERKGMSNVYLHQGRFLNQVRKITGSCPAFYALPSMFPYPDGNYRAIAVLWLICGMNPPKNSHEKGKYELHLKNVVSVALRTMLTSYVMWDWSANVRKHAIRSAVAAIMARNMSHNIGSHVLANIASSVVNERPEDVSMLNSYLQERMDFVARVATEWPDWSEPVFFFSDLLQRFLNQGLLLDFLATDDGYGGKEISFTTIKKGEQVYRFSYRSESEVEQREEKKFSAFKLESDGNTESLGGVKDFLVSVPGGAVGKQAFYGFLENAIRNAAKHNPKPSNDTKFNISLAIEESANKEFYTVRYCDNISQNIAVRVGNQKETTLVEKIRKIIETDIINEKGETTRENWGIQEMKVYADFMSYPFISGPGEYSVGKNASGRKCRLWPEEYEYPKEKGLEAIKVLSYKFCLPRAKLILFVDGNEELQSLQKNAAQEIGVYFTKPTVGQEGELIKEIQHLSPQLVVFVPSKDYTLRNVEEFIWENDPYLPSRILIMIPSLSEDQQNSSGRFFFCERKEYPGNGLQDIWERFVLRVYKEWVIRFTNSDSDTVFNIIVNFERGDGFTGFTKWETLQQSLREYGLCNVNINLFRSGKNARGQRVCELIFGTQIDTGLQNTKTMVFDNHGLARKHLSDANSTFTSVLYQVIGHDRDLRINNHTIFEQFQNTPTGFSGVLFILQLIETSLMKILLIDERIASFVAHVVSKEVQHKSSDNHVSLIRAGIHYVLSFRHNRDRVFLLKKDDPRTTSLGEDGIEGITLEDNKVRRIGIYSQKKEAFGISENLRFDAVVIHWGWLEYLQETLKTDPRVILTSLKKFSPKIILTSGRGKTKEIPAHLPFVEFSSIQNVAVNELSKYHLGKMLFSVIAKKESRANA